MVSDHCAIVVKSLLKDWSPKPFRTIDAWYTESGFKELVQNKWSKYRVHGNSVSNLKDKLKILKVDLRVWNKEVFGCLETNKTRILKEIEELDCCDANNDLEEPAKLRRYELVSQLRMIDKKSESLCRQKARVKWFKFGDSNTKYFHSILRWRRLRNEVEGVMVGNQWCEDPEVVRKEAKKMFEDRFKATYDFGVRLDQVDFKSLSTEASSNMITSFTGEEIKEAVWQCEGSKSPNPDGFNFTFIKNSWGTLKQDIVEAVRWFQNTGSIPKGCNASFITLVPKVRDPVNLDQYRPISLVGNFYKIITKVLSGRIRNVISKVIDTSQSAFLKDRGMLDSVLVANEVVEELRRYGKSGLCLKVDYEKAYDSVRWEFLYYMIRRLGFHHRWIMWIKGCLESATVSVLVNGSLTTEFKPSRGLR